MVESVMVDQNKAGAIDKTEILIIVSYENRLGSLFDCCTNTEGSDPSLVKTSHKLDSRSVTDFGSNESIGLREDKIGC